MKINPTNLYNSLNFSYAMKKPPVFYSLKKDTFEKSQVSFKGVPFGVNDDVKKIPYSFFDICMKNVDDETKNAAKESVFVAKITKDMLDEKYGENNYVTVSIGTSPAGVCKALELMGNDVRYVPISDVRWHPDWYIEDTLDKKAQPEYVKFLKSAKLGLSDLKKDKRQYIFIDYTNSGKTLSKLERAAKRTGADEKQCHFLSLNRELRNYVNQRGTKKEKERLEDYITKYLYLSEIGDFSGIPHVYLTMLHEIENATNYEKNQRQLNFELALLYYIGSKNKNEN